MFMTPNEIVSRYMNKYYPDQTIKAKNRVLFLVSSLDRNAQMASSAR